MIIFCILATDTLWSDPGTGPWHSAPIRWYGDTAHAIRTVDGVQLDAPTPGKSFLWADAPLIPPAEWHGNITLNFNPSSSNYYEMRFAEDGTGNGVGVRFGATDDGISIGKLTKNSLTTWAKSEPGILNNERSKIHWRLTWSKQNYWTLSFDCDSIWSALDSIAFTPTEPCRFVGWKAVYTSSNRNRFTIGPLTLFGRVHPEPVEEPPLDRPEPMHDSLWRITEILASPSPTRTDAPNVDFVEIHYIGTDSIRTEGWSLSVNQYTYPLSPKSWNPGEVAVVGDSNGFPPELRPKVWHGKIQILSSYCWIQLRDAYRRPIAQSHIDPKWFVPSDKSKGGFSWEAKSINLSCLNPTGWGVSDESRGCSPGMIPNSSNLPIDLRTGGIIRWRWVNEQTIELGFRHPMNCVNRKLVTLSLDSTISDSIWATSPTSWIVHWSIPLDWTNTHSKWLIFNNIKHCDGTDLDTILEIGWPKSAVPGDWQISELLLNPLPGESRYVELLNTSDKWLNLGDLRMISVDPITQGELAYRVLAEPGVCVAPKSCVAISESWIHPTSRFLELDSFRLYQSPTTLPWNDDLAVGRMVDADGRLLVTFNANKSDHHLGLVRTEGHSLVPIYNHEHDTALFEWTSHSPGVGSPGIVPYFEVNPNPILHWQIRNNRCRWGSPAVVEYHNLAEPVLAECWISTLSGHRIVQIMARELVGRSGLFVWDGQMANGLLAPNGTYLMCVRGVDAKNRAFAKSWGIQVQ